jgi:hypothetical protein
MIGSRTIYEAGPGGEYLPEKELQAALACAERLRRRGRSRAAAALFLHAAAMTESAAAREALRRRSAQLLSERRDDQGRCLAC